MKCLFSLVMFLVSNHAYCGIGPRVYSAVEKSKNASLNMECEGEAPGFEKLECHFIRVDIARFKKTDLESEFKADLKKLKGFRDSCGKVKSRDLKQVEEMDSRRIAYMKEQNALLDENCKCAKLSDDKGLECLQKNLTKAMNVKLKTCVLNTKFFNYSFKKVNEDKWAFLEETPGDCGKKLNVQILKEKNNNFFYSITMQSALKGKPEICKPEKPDESETFSLKYNVPIQDSCEYIRYGT